MTAFEVVIRLGRSFDVQTGSGVFAAGVREITIPFLDRESAEAAQREIEVSVRRVHDAGGEDYRVVVPGDVVESGETVVILAPGPGLGDVRGDLARDMRDLRDLEGK